MNSLPTELLQAAFEIFVLVSCGSPKILCSISRKWRIAALLTPKVWSRIAVAHGTGRLVWNPIPDASYTICETEDSLKTILARAGSTKLDVYIGNNVYTAFPYLKTISNVWTNIDRDWLAKRCRKLTLWGTVHTRDPWVRGLAELEEVVFPYEGSITTWICEDMQANSPKLFSMELTDRALHVLPRIPALAARLRIIHISGKYSKDKLGGYDQRMILPQLDCVEELLWTNLFTASPFPPTTNRLCVLTINGYDYLEPNRTEWSSLTELRLVEGPLSIPRTQPSLFLPVLETLVLEGLWVELAWIRAPALKILRLLRGGNRDSLTVRREALFACTLRPSIVYMEISLTTVTMLFLLQGVWSEIQELHCTFHFSDNLLQFPKELVGNLSRTWSTHGKVEICPRLGAFTTLLVCESRAELRSKATAVTSAMETMVKNRSSFYPLTVALLGLKSSSSYGESTEWSSFA